MSTHGERRTVHPCWPEDSISAAHLAPGRAGHEGEGGGRPPRAYAYTAAGVAARMGIGQARCRRLLGGDAGLRDPFTVVAAIIASRSGRRLTRKMIEGIAAQLREVSGFSGGLPSARAGE